MLSLPKSILSMKTVMKNNEDGVEQAFVNLALGNGDVITAGRYASMLGFEAYEPTGLYQYSTAYTLDGQAVSAASQYVQGVKYTRTTDTTFFGISLQDQAFGNDGDRLGGDVRATALTQLKWLVRSTSAMASPCLPVALSKMLNQVIIN